MGRPAPTLRGRRLVPSLRATSAGAAELPPALLPALGAATGAARSTLGAGTADAGMLRGRRGSQSPAPATCTSTQGHQVCNGSRGAHPFPPQLPVPLLAGGTERPGAAQGQPTRAVPTDGRGAVPADWPQASRAMLLCWPRPLRAAGHSQPCLPPPVPLMAPQHHIQILATKVQEALAPQESRQQDGAGLRGSSGQKPWAFLPVQGEAKLLGDPRMDPHPRPTSSTLWQEPGQHSLPPA